jgi:pre-peptidase
MATAALATGPQLSSITPPGGQRGTELEVRFNGERLDDAQEIVFYGPGIEVLELKTNKARLKIASDCRLGEHHVRIRAASGISDLRMFYVGPFASTNETEPNNELAKAQAIPLNVTVQGAAGGEDLDYFQISAKKDQPIAVEVEAIRLGRALLDPFISIQTKDGKVLAGSDDTALLAQDGAFSILAPADGEYIIQVRDSTYTGPGDTPYRLHVGNFPRPMAVYPAGGKAGEKLKVQFIGDAAGAFAQEVSLPKEPQEKFGVFAERDGKIAPSPNWVRVSRFPNAVEKEPNDDNEKATDAGGDLPIALNGILEKDGDEDWFRFKGTKDQALEVSVFGRRIRSPIDSVALIQDEKGNTVAQNDDTGGPDSSIKFTPSKDGYYFLKISDHLKKGGPDYIYRVEVVPPAPSVTVSIPQVARNDSQNRQWIAVPRGNRFGTLVRASRNNFSGDLAFGLEGLPEGIKMQAETMPGRIDSMPLVFEAAADAPLAGKLLELTAASTESSKPVRGAFRHQMEFIQGPNNTFYYHTRADKLYVAVVEAAPFKIEIDEVKVPLVQGGSMALKVKATRDSGFDEPINLKMIWNPSGVSSSSDITMAKGANDAVCTLNASGNAELRKWKVAVLGWATVNGGSVYVSTPLTPLEIAEPYISGKIETVAVSPGQSAKLVCKLEQKKAFEGKATVKLMGLPDKITAPEVQITKEDKEAAFNITVDPKCSNGSHKNLFCHVEIVEHEQPIPHNIASGGVLRVVPPKKSVEEPKKVASAQGGK